MATTPYAANDPFSGGVRIPSLSWKALPIGSTFTLQVLEGAKLLQSRNFETNEPAYWDDEKQNPVMSAVVNVRVLTGPHSVGEDRSIWAQKPSDLFAAIAAAQQAAGTQIAPGGTLHLRFIGETPHKDKRYSPIKNYAAKYDPPTASDAFTETPVAQPQYAQPARTAQPLPSAAQVQQQITPPVAPGWPAIPAAGAKVTW
jgi:hypothetical protein